MDPHPKLYTPDSKMVKEQNQNIQVYARVRPMNGHERSKNSLTVLDTPGNREVVVKERSANNLTKTFTFDRVFGPASKQIDVYKVVVAPLIEQVLLGYNCTVFAYGQTGTGKTFTMEGERSVGGKADSFTWETDPLTGIVPRALSQLFDELRLQNAEFSVRVSHLELYNEELFDLLSPTDDSMLRTLRLYEDSGRKGSVVIQGLEEVTVHSKHEVYAIMERGSIRRKTAATQMNAHSSRSHTVFTLTVHIKETSLEGEELLKIGKLHLVDLAGSENIGRSGAVDKRAREAGSINQSLLTLGRVITALVERAPHVPYRESKLTRILQDSLGGRTKTSIIATVSPASYNVEETLSTLDYAHRAKNITNRPEINQKLTKRAMLKNYTEEIERLRRDLVATREKNGVYMDKENYDAITSQLDCQNQDLSEKIAQVRVLQETIEQKDVELNNVNLQWEETKDDLASANQVIDETRLRLSQTLMLLHETEVQKEQQEHLVEKHVFTEKLLSSEAAQLMLTTEESTSNLEKLYRKLDRKKNVEQTNLDAGRRFNDDLGKQFTSMCAALEGFRVDHASFCGVQRLKLESFLQGKETQFAILHNQVADFLKQVSDRVAVSQTLVENEVKSSERWTSSFGNDICAKTNYAIKEVELWKESVFNDVTVKLQEQLKSLLDQMNQVGSAFKLHMSQQDALLSEYITARVVKLEENRKSVEKLLFDQVEANGLAVACAKRTEDVAAEYVKNFENTAGTLISELQKMIQNSSSLKAVLANNSNTQIDGLTNSVKALQKFASDLSADFEVNQKEVDLLKINSSGIAKAAGSTLQGNMKQCLDMHESGVQSIASLQETMNTHAETQRRLMLETQQHVTTKSNSRHLEAKSFGSEYGKNAKMLDNAIDETVSQLSKTLNSQIETDRNFVTEEMNEVYVHCTEVSKWSDDTRAQVLQQSGKLSEFWESTYVIDLPSGVTPQRKTYDYPRNLSATSPHERILSRFQTKRKPPPAEINEVF